jgi:flagella basal body P-ring formation protein FlgA
MKHVRRATFHVLAVVVRYGFPIISVLLAGSAIFLALPANSTQPVSQKPLPPPNFSPLPQLISPAMVDVPVPTKAIAAGDLINEPSDVEWRPFVRAELSGKVFQREQLRHTIAKQVLARGQPISTDEVEPYVMLPVAESPQSAGEIIQEGHLGFTLRAIGRSQVADGQIVSLTELDNKLVVSPIPAEQPIPRASLDDYVVLPVLRSALASGAPFRLQNVHHRTFPYQAIKSDLNVLVLNDTDLLEQPKFVSKDQNLAPDTPIKRDAVSP